MTFPLLFVKETVWWMFLYVTLFAVRTELDFSGTNKGRFIKEIITESKQILGAWLFRGERKEVIYQESRWETVSHFLKPCTVKTKMQSQEFGSSWWFILDSFSRFWSVDLIMSPLFEKKGLLEPLVWSCGLFCTKTFMELTTDGHVICFLLKKKKGL